jgi:hypothetical protein
MNRWLYKHSLPNKVCEGDAPRGVKTVVNEKYLAEEVCEAEIQLSQDEWDIDEITFSDEGEITIEDLKTSPALKIAYGRFISATNWLRWCLA